MILFRSLSSVPVWSTGGCCSLNHRDRSQQSTVGIHQVLCKGILMVRVFAVPDPVVSRHRCHHIVVQKVLHLWGRVTKCIAPFHERCPDSGDVDHGAEVQPILCLSRQFHTVEIALDRIDLQFVLTEKFKMCKRYCACSSGSCATIPPFCEAVLRPRNCDSDRDTYERADCLDPCRPIDAGCFGRAVVDAFHANSPVLWVEA